MQVVWLPQEMVVRGRSRSLPWGRSAWFGMPIRRERAPGRKEKSSSLLVPSAQPVERVSGSLGVGDRKAETTCQVGTDTAALMSRRADSLAPVHPSRGGLVPCLTDVPSRARSLAMSTGDYAWRLPLDVAGQLITSLSAKTARCSLRSSGEASSLVTKAALCL
jgi:hypothetical protein